MPLDEPGWWYREDRGAGGLGRLLGPVGTLYGAVVERRFRATVPRISELPVLCVGNFTAGGTGKTPLARYLADVLRSKVGPTAILSRGYGGSRSGPVWVDPATHTSGDIGDEPLLIAAGAPVMVARDRRAGLAAIVASGEAHAVIMDDGLQNPHVAKHLTIAVVDARRGFGNGLVIPAGPLRARLDFQLGLVDCIVVMGDARPDDPAPVFDGLKARFHGPVLRARVGPVGDVAWVAGKTLVAFAGIANPERFFRLLVSFAPDAVLRRPFRDHHEFSEEDAAALMREADRVGGLLVTTEKDLARLAGRSGGRGALAQRAKALPVAVVFDDTDRMRLDALIDGALRVAGATAPRRLTPESDAGA